MHLYKCTQDLFTFTGHTQHPYCLCVLLYWASYPFNEPPTNLRTSSFGVPTSARMFQRYLYTQTPRIVRSQNPQTILLQCPTVQRSW